MKVGILSESDADEASIKILAEAVLGHPLEIIEPVRVRTRGWAAVITNLPSYYKALHWHPDADGLIAVLDSDETPTHDRSHEEAGFIHVDCRFCMIQRLAFKLGNEVAPRSQGALKTAFGLAVPAIEAWYQCGLDVHCTEPHFMRQPAIALTQIRRELKRKCYGAVSVPRPVLKTKAIEYSARLSGTLDLLERNFPNGFGALARSLRAWKSSP